MAEAGKQLLFGLSILALVFQSGADHQNSSTIRITPTWEFVDPAPKVIISCKMDEHGDPKDCELMNGATLDEVMKSVQDFTAKHCR